MLKINITPDICQQAEKLANHEVYKKSIRGQEANLVGAYGEVLAHKYLTACGYKPKFVHQYNHDIECAGYTIDVKTKERTVAPKLHYDCTVPAYNHDNQKPDAFIFVSLLANLSGRRRFACGWILGSIRYDELSRNSKLWKKGERDPDNGWVATIDCYNVPVSLLQPPAIKSF